MSDDERLSRELIRELGMFGWGIVSIANRLRDRRLSTGEAIAEARKAVARASAVIDKEDGDAKRE